MFRSVFRLRVIAEPRPTHQVPETIRPRLRSRQLRRTIRPRQTIRLQRGSLPIRQTIRSREEEATTTNTGSILPRLRYNILI